MRGFEHLDENEFAELKRVFYAQAYEMLDDIQDLVLRLEAEPTDGDIIKTIQRYFHTLKGDSNSLGLADVGSICHKVEDILAFLKNNRQEIDADAVGLLLKCVEGIGALVGADESGQECGDMQEVFSAMDEFLSVHGTVENKQVKGESYSEYEILQMDDAVAHGMKLYAVELVFDPLCAERGVAAFMIGQRMNGFGRIIRSQPELESEQVESSDRLSILVAAACGADEIGKNISIAGITGGIQIREVKQATYGRAERGDNKGTRAVQSEAAAHYKNETLRVEMSKVDGLMDLVGELIIGRSIIEQIAKDMSEGIPVQDAAGRLLTANSFMERTVSDLQKNAMTMRMVPVNHAFRKFPKMVRDLSLEKGKSIRLDIFGKETELDKGLVDILGEPLSHIVRNLIDHGIEGPSFRRSVGKPEEGVITLNAYHEAAQIVIEASDDGRGIDVTKLRQKAVERGFLGAADAERLTDGEAANLIFISGLSTSDSVSDISGRGIGMDVVKSAIEGLKGSVAVESSAGKGTKFILRLPLTLAVIKAMLFEIGQRLYSVPVSSVAEVSRTITTDLTTVDGHTTLMLRDQLISIISLEKIFGIMRGDTKKKFVLILGVGSKKIGLLVDRLIGQQELVIKAVDGRYTKTGLVSGASILGNGRVVLILDVPAVVSKAIEEEKTRMVGA